MKLNNKNEIIFSTLELWSWILYYPMRGREGERLKRTRNRWPMHDVRSIHVPGHVAYPKSILWNCVSRGLSVHVAYFQNKDI